MRVLGKREGKRWECWERGKGGDVGVGERWGCCEREQERDEEVVREGGKERNRERKRVMEWGRWTRMRG